MVMSVPSSLANMEGIADGPLIIIGFALLMLGGEFVVQGAVTIAGRLRVPPLLVGFTIVAVGTSLPELAVALEAVRTDADEIAVGGVLGSNVANVMLVLGTAAILGATSDTGEGVRRDSAAVAAATAMLLIAVIMGEIAQVFGIVMLVGLVAYYVYSYRQSKVEGTDVEDSDTWLPDYMLLAIPATILGGWMIWNGAELLVEGATGLASIYGIPKSVVGLSIVALGTSLPELAVTLVAGLRGQGGVAVGNVLGSNVMNILGILGFAATYSGGLIVAPEFAQRDIWVVILTSGFIVAMLYYEREIGKRLGFGMVLGYLSYMALLYI